MTQKTDMTTSAPGGLARSIPLMNNDTEPTIFEISVDGRSAASFRTTDIPEWSIDELVPAQHQRSEKALTASVSERDLVAHYTRLTHRQYSVDLGAYPLGSCTMKYNPKLCDEAAALPGLTNVHPAAPAWTTQGWIELLADLSDALCAITGMHQVTLQPPAGAAGELTGLLLMRAYDAAKGQTRHKVIIPDSAHGTNPASVTLAGYETVTIPTNSKGCVDIDALRAAMSKDVAGVMLTNPNTLGLFEEQIVEIAAIAHEADALLYYDGANLNAILGVVRPGDMGFDIVHMNLHKTFAVPHGGGGPGAGPVGVSERLAKFLPGPLPLRKDDDTFDWFTPEQSIGRVHGWHGNALALARAWSYILANGADGLKHVAEIAVLNANWMRKRLSDTFPPAFDRPNMHEVVFSAAEFKKQTGVKAFDIAKRLLEEGFHSPTMYFPLIVDEALMIEPTETESPQTLEALALAFERIAAEAIQDGGKAAHASPRTTPVGRVDEARAARNVIPTFDARPQS